MRAGGLLGMEINCAGGSEYGVMVVVTVGCLYAEHDSTLSMSAYLVMETDIYRKLLFGWLWFNLLCMILPREKFETGLILVGWSDGLMKYMQGVSW